MNGQSSGQIGSVAPRIRSICNGRKRAKELREWIGFGFIREDGGKDGFMHRLVIRLWILNHAKKEARLVSGLFKA